MLGVARRFALIMLIPVAAAAGELRSLGTVKLHDVVVVNEQDATTIVLKTSAPARYQAEFMDSPYRLVVDFPDTTLTWRNTPLHVGSAPLRQVRGSQYRKDVTRVVIEFTRRAGYVITEESDSLVIAVPKTEHAAVPARRPTPPPAPTAVARLDVPKAPAVITAAVATRPKTTAVAQPEIAPIQPNQIGRAHV